MGKDSSSRVVLSTAAIGAVAGYLALHPYTMVVYGLYEMRARTGLPIRLHDITRHFVTAFEPQMLYMGLPFVVLGGAAGMFFGFWLVARRQRQKMELRACAVDTLKQLMVTLSHYLLNAGTVIGGFAARAGRKESDPEIKGHLAAIRKEAECIEAVVKSLQGLESVTTEHYTKDSETMIIDLTEELKKRVAEKAPGHEHEVSG